MKLLDLGVADYLETHTLQSELVEARTRGEIEDTLILVEHTPVFTRGRKCRDNANLLAPGDVPVVDVERGGDITFHGPGQLVAYPIVKLPEGRRDAPKFIRHLEGWIIAGMAALGVADGERRPPFSGVWCQGQKVASVGIAVTAQWVSWHGIALNVCTDMHYFERINPCGLEAQIMTSLSQLAGQPVAMNDARQVLGRLVPLTLPR